MQTEELILAEEFCHYYNVDYSFLRDLQGFGLIEITTAGEANYIDQNQLQKLEQIIRLHFELHINLEGIDAITNLLERMSSMQSEIVTLKNRLKLYEEF